MKRDRTPGIDPNDKQNRISEGTKIVGDIFSQGGFRIDGEVEGKIRSSGKIVLGPQGVIKGTLSCKDADIEGAFQGTIQISDLLALKSTAHIEGEVSTSKLSVEPGATFNATIEMKGTVKGLDTSSSANATKKETEKSA